MTYPIAPNGLFWSVQGEGALLGVPMRFVRLAGCPIGCRECDTDYTVDRRMSVPEIVAELAAMPPAKWTWVTGGEPTIHDLGPLWKACSLMGFTALATSGRIPTHASFKFVSVSPHGTPSDLVITKGQQFNLVPRLNGLKLENWGDFRGDFAYRYVTPLHGSQDSLNECLDWLKRHPDWRLGTQAHKTWGLA